MTGRHRDFALRHAVAKIVWEAGSEGIALPNLTPRLLEVFQDMGLASKRLGIDDRKLWSKALDFEIAGEFCRSTRQRISLENLAIIEVRYEFLDELAGDEKFGTHLAEHGDLRGSRRNSCPRRTRSNAPPPGGRLDFFQRYLNPTAMPWVQLTDEPFSVTFPERELGPVFFVQSVPKQPGIDRRVLRSSRLSTILSEVQRVWFQS